MWRKQLAEAAPRLSERRPGHVTRRRSLGIATAVGAAALIAAPLATISVAEATTTNTFTTIATSANPVLVGVHFTVSGTECDRVADVHATGTMVFKDKTTGLILGTETLTPDPTFENCSDASVTDTESLAAGNYRIVDHYRPGGSTPIQTSPNASYVEHVVSPVFTDISWTAGAAVPHPHVEGAAVGLGGNVYDISGSSGDCTDGSCGTIQSSVDVYNAASGTFHSAAAIPNPREADPAAVVIAGKIYVVGGTNASGTVLPVDVYTPGSGWSTLPSTADLPSGTYGAYGCAAADGSDVFYFDPEHHTVNTLDTSAATPAWTTSVAQALLNPSSFCSAAQVGPSDPTSKTSQIIIVGAGDGSADAYSQRVLIFTPATGVMRLGQGTTVPIAEQSAAELDGTFVTAGGDFDPSSVEGVAPGQGSVSTYSNLPEPRDDAAGGSVVGGKFFIVGGVDGSNNLPTVMIGTPN